MSQTLPALRRDLDFMPSPDERHPGLLIRDSFRYSDSVIIVPPPLVPFLAYFDGEQPESELRAALVEATGQFEVTPVIDNLKAALRQAGFLEDETFAALREARHKEFAEAPVRVPSHAGPGGYPEERIELDAMMEEYFSGAEPAAPDALCGIAAPHVSPFGGWECYRDAYAALTPVLADRTFVLLGTSHYGEPGRFGLTRKPFVTPYGQTETALELIGELESRGGRAVKMEDYCHAVEHSIEFQVIFLQRVFGPRVRILPVLCGAFAASVYGPQPTPEHDEHVKQFLDVLGEVNAREGKKLFWVLGVDMAHMGRRYGDQHPYEAERDLALAVRERDQQRIEHLSRGDAETYWELVREREDDLKWCGSAPFYTFLRAVPQARGTLKRYQQWNIDDQSIVSFAGMTFRA
jgi:hypothetical protein